MKTYQSGRVTRGPLAGSCVTTYLARWYYARTATYWPDGMNREPAIETDHGWYVWAPDEQVWLWEPLQDHEQET